MTTPPGPEPDKNPWLGEPTVPPGGTPGYQPYGQPPPPPQPYGQQPYGQQPYGQQQGTNGLAIASLVTSLVWVCGIGSIAAIVMGHLARGQIKRTGEKGEGMALAGLILGYLGIAVVIGYIVLVVVVYAVDPNAYD